MTTQAQARAAIKALSPNLTFKKTESGDFRVSLSVDYFKAQGFSHVEAMARNEAVSYESDDLDDVIGTARHMIETASASDNARASAAASASASPLYHDLARVDETGETLAPREWGARSGEAGEGAAFCPYRTTYQGGTEREEAAREEWLIGWRGAHGRAHGFVPMRPVD